MIKIHSEQDELLQVVLTLKDCEPIPGAIVRSFEREEDMLLEWERLVQHLDPDFLVGYNITNFDFPYILERAEHLQIRKSRGGFGYLGRILGLKAQIK